MKTTFNIELAAKPNKNGLYPVFIRITQQRRHKRLKTGIEVRSDDFSKKAKHGSWIKSSEPLFKTYNATIEAEYNKVKKEYNDLQRTQVSEPTPGEVKMRLNNGGGDFLAFMRERIKFWHNQGSFANAKAYEAAYGHLMAYKNELPVDHITVAFLDGFKTYLIGKGLHHNSIVKYLKTVRATLYAAIRADLIQQERNPFFKIGSERVS